jgi:hypothetical protein
MDILDEFWNGVSRLRTYLYPAYVTTDKKRCVTDHSPSGLSSRWRGTPYWRRTQRETWRWHRRECESYGYPKETNTQAGIDGRRASQ